jgi:hypothetical protein
MAHRRALFDVPFGTLAGQRPYAADVAGPLGYADRPAGIEQVEHM